MGTVIGKRVFQRSQRIWMPMKLWKADHGEIPLKGAVYMDMREVFTIDGRRFSNIGRFL